MIYDEYFDSLYYISRSECNLSVTKVGSGFFNGLAFVIVRLVQLPMGRLHFRTGTGRTNFEDVLAICIVGMFKFPSGSHLVGSSLAFALEVLV